MNQRNQIRPLGLQRTAAALLTLLAILIAPVCAPLCAAKHCSPAARLEQCHKTASTGDRSGDVLVAPGKDCAIADFSAVVVKAEEHSPLKRAARSDPAPAPIHLSLESVVGSLHASRDRWDIHRIPLESPDSLKLTTILRV